MCLSLKLPVIMKCSGISLFLLYQSCLLILVSWWQNGLDTKVEKSRKQMKERKNRAKKIRGVKKVNNCL